MAYNNHEMKRLLMVLTVVCILFSAATISCSMDIGLYGENVRSPVVGTLYIPLPETVPYDFQTAGLGGDVQILIGNHRELMNPSLIEYDHSLHRLKVPLDMTVSFEGVAVIICVSRLTYTPPAPEEEDQTGEENPEEAGTDDPDPADQEDGITTDEDTPEPTPIPYAGYLITSLTKDRINWINDTDHDNQLSFDEGETTPLLPAVHFYTDYMETEPVQVENKPVIERFNSTPQISTTNLSISLSGAVSSLDWGLVYVRINNQYRWIEALQDPFEPDRVSFPESDEDPFRITLNPGQNEIQLFAVNSHGVTLSDVIRVDCNPPLHEEMENILVTLTWDTVADLDLHTWYYVPEEEEFIWHNSYANPEAPDSDDIKNLDADTQKGFGPEHFTLLGAPDGYYILAVNAYSLGGLPAANAFVSIETNHWLHSLGPFRITEENADDYPVNGDNAWARVADIRIMEGVAEILKPDMNLNPPNMFAPQLSLTAPVRSIKHALKNH